MLANGSEVPVLLIIGFLKSNSLKGGNHGTGYLSKGQ
jgi:hypothetical protein